jgi:hypothetical protein
MDRESIIRMAREAGFEFKDRAETRVERFAALVAAAERVAWAKVCDDLVLAHPGRADLTADQCAAAIRARGQA